MKNKGKMKNSTKAGPKKVLPVDKAVAIIEKLEAKVNEVVKRHNELAEQQQKLGQFVAMEFGKLGAMYQLAINQITESIEHLDLNVLATAEIVKELFAQTYQLIAHVSPVQLGEEAVAAAQAQFDAMVASAFEKVQKLRAEEEEKRQADALKAKEEAAKAAKEAQDKTEAERAEAELQKAAAPDLAPVAGGPGVDAPEGADVFGG